MRNESRIEELLEKLFDSNSTPEVICARDPELLDEVRTRWRLMRQVTDRIDDLFPTDRPANRDDCDAVQAENELPRIDGYDVEAILGRGGMGVVFKARHHKLNRFVAIKMMRAGSYADPTQRARFRREAEAVAAIRHPNIVEIHDVGDSPGSQYFTMELLEGRSLAEKLAGKPQPARQAAELIATLASAVQFAHQSGFIHRDLKPSNILFTVGGFPKIADFGLVRPIQSGPEYTFSGADRHAQLHGAGAGAGTDACHRPCRGYLCLGSGALRDAHRASPVCGGVCGRTRTPGGRQGTAATVAIERQSAARLGDDLSEVPGKESRPALRQRAGPGR